MPSKKIPSVEEFQKIILDNYQAHARIFPWKQTRDPYAILVSEIMLQQTQTERVIPKYNSWLEKFPTVHDVAKAQLAEVLAMWSGLGYNRRAKFLHEACKKLADIIYSTGIFPTTAQELEKLPGIGHYTARAVVTYAFNNEEIFIETNIRSVFLFFFFQDRLQAPTYEPVHDNEIFPLIEKTLYKNDPRTWYYALMDYGAELKKTVKNPNRKSKHYAKQSKFEGSIRQARGAILRQLSNTSESMTLTTIAHAENIDYSRILSASELLCAEKLIQKQGDLYSISE